MRILLLSLLLVFSVFGQNEKGKALVSALCSPSFHGRGYVNGGDSLAADFIAKSFQEIGLKSYGGSFFQLFEFPVQTFPGECTAAIGTDTLIPGVHYLIAPNSGPSCSSTDCLQGKYYRIIKCDLQTLYTSTTSFYPCPDNVMLAVQSFGMSSDSLKIIQTRIRELSVFAPVMEITQEKLTWSVSQTANIYPYIQVQDSILREQTESLFYLHLQTKFKPRHVARNVIAFIPAKRQAKKKPTIFISAHYDHLGRMGLSTYFPGANDNASGNGMLLSIADELVKSPLAKYNIAFIAFAGEEAGLLGSKFMVEHPIVPLNQIRFLLNLDIMGSGEEGITCVNSTLFKPEFDQLQQINERSNYLALIKQRGPAANSDHYFFTKAGVPAFFIYTMGPNKNYHDIFDTYEALSFKKFDAIELLLLEFIRSF